MREQLRYVGMALLVVGIISGFIMIQKATPAQATKTETPVDNTDWQLVKVNEGGRLKYAIRYCDSPTSNNCHWTGYRFELDEYEYAENLWKSFAHPNPYPSVVEVVKSK